MIITSPGQVTAPPQRIVSLVPSQTELLASLQLDKETIGITKFCVHPPQWRKEKTIVGGTKKLHLDKISAIQPDLIIANKEENLKEEVLQLAANFPTYVTDINNLDDAIEMINDIGALTGKAAGALMLAKQVKDGFSKIIPLKAALNTAYIIWKDPLMTTGGDTFIHNMLTLCGCKNIFGQSQRYPSITIDDLKGKGCQLLLLSSEPYPFKEKHIIEFQQQLPGVKILLVDGEMFSWYGSRLLIAPTYFNILITEVQRIGAA